MAFHSASHARPIVIHSVICTCRIFAHDSDDFLEISSQFLYNKTQIAISAAITAIIAHAGAEIPMTATPTARAIGINFHDHNNESASHAIFSAAIHFVTPTTANARDERAKIAPVTTTTNPVIPAMIFGCAFENSVNFTIIGVITL